MIDIHCHIIPGVDDGPDSFDEALEMAEIAEKDGINTIVATPHHIEGLYQISPLNLLEKLKTFNERLATNNIKIQILMGSDLHISYEFIAKIETNNLLTINDTKYVLIELPTHFLPIKIRGLLKSMINNSWIPIISHPERNYLFQRSPNILFDFISDGSLAQVTAMSITGEFGYEVKKMAKKMIAHNLVHIIATDAHSKDFRPPVLSKGLKAASKIIPYDDAYDMVKAIPESIIKGDAVFTNPPQRIRKIFNLF